MPKRSFKEAGLQQASGQHVAAVPVSQHPTAMETAGSAEDCLSDADSQNPDLRINNRRFLASVVSSILECR